VAAPSDGGAAVPSDSSLFDREESARDVSNPPLDERDAPRLPGDEAVDVDIVSEEDNPPTAVDARDAAAIEDVAVDIGSRVIDAAGDVMDADCPENRRRCNATQPQVCGVTGWIDDGPPCPCGVCSGGYCLGTCVPGSRSCTGLVAQACVGCAWTNVEVCRFVCVAGACRGECLPGAKRCDVDSGVPQTCGADGTWFDGPPCPGGCVGAGVCASDGGLPEDGGPSRD
jgi:hypothetical protein